MAGLDPAIHGTRATARASLGRSSTLRVLAVDARVKPAHDELGEPV
jgi:hypothetical protein